MECYYTFISLAGKTTNGSFMREFQNNSSINAVDISNDRTHHIILIQLKKIKIKRKRKRQQPANEVLNVLAYSITRITSENERALTL